MREFDCHRRGILSKRVLYVILPLALLTGVSLWYFKQQEALAVRKADDWATERFGLTKPSKNRLAATYVDADGDLLADRPAADQCIDPDIIYFSYMTGDGPEHRAATWGGFTTALSKALGRPVEFKEFRTVDDQLMALASGQLHITGVNTGAVPKSVNASGFVPMFVIGNQDGTFGYTMKFIVPSDSEIQGIADLKGERITFTTTNSNSGFKAPVVTLMYDHDMQPGRDYDYGFSTSHDESIRLVANKEITVATVASDMLDRAVARGDVERAMLREVYTSERFPSAAIGCAFNLDEALVEEIADAIANFQIGGTELQSAIGLPNDAKFLPVSYKDEWALIRRTDDALGVIHELEAPVDTASGASSPAEQAASAADSDAESTAKPGVGEEAPVVAESSQSDE